MIRASTGERLDGKRRPDCRSLKKFMGAGVPISRGLVGNVRQSFSGLVRHLPREIIKIVINCNEL
jgi:hypothetical protein